MPASKLVRIALAAAGLAGLAAAAILLNLALLGYAQPRNDPVGKLSPRAVLTGASPSRPAPPARTTTEPGDDDHHEDDNDD